jgi:hypothetical protein
VVAGALLLALLVTLVWHFGQQRDPARALALKASRVDLVGAMLAGLASASEAEKSAVLAITDQDSQAFADQARAATAEVERERQELGKLLATQGERDLLAQFTEAFANLQRIDEEVLGLAVKNTNLKAYALAFGPAADAQAELDAALARVLAKRAQALDAPRVAQLAFGARLGLLRIQALLAPHIAEESDAKMDQLEAVMAREGRQVQRDLDGLEALPALQGDTDVATAVSSFAHYRDLEVRILALSRENTNVRSLSLSLNQKRKAMTVSLDALNALRQAILEEPIAGVTYGRPQLPR